MVSFDIEVDLNTILILATLVYMFLIRTRYERKKVDEQKKQRRLKEIELEENGVIKNGE